MQRLQLGVSPFCEAILQIANSVLNKLLEMYRYMNFDDRCNVSMKILMVQSTMEIPRTCLKMPQASFPKTLGATSSLRSSAGASTTPQTHTTTSIANSVAANQVPLQLHNNTNHTICLSSSAAAPSSPPSRRSQQQRLRLTWSLTCTAGMDVPVLNVTMNQCQFNAIA